MKSKVSWFSTLVVVTLVSVASELVHPNLWLSKLRLPSLWRPSPQEFKLPPPLTQLVLSADDLKFGREQMEKIYRDRPKLGELVVKDDALYLWAVRQFAGEASGHRVLWDPSAPDGPAWSLSSSVPPVSGVLGAIKIRAKYPAGPMFGQDLSCDKLWSCLVFELYNHSTNSAFEGIVSEALAGKIDRTATIFEIAKVEYLNVQKTKRFYLNAWAPFCARKGAVPVAEDWFQYEPDTYEHWIKQFQGPEDYPIANYGPWYDKSVAPYLKRQD
ncbi:hypothetical protein EON80_03305 [bacterium]|nr:MAG: hypothetical protein EON80_03305 [bacterium]